MNETSKATVPNRGFNERPRFSVELVKEFVSALVVIPIVWIIARLFHTEFGGVEFVAAPVILAWFAVRGWKTDDPAWPGRLPVWRFVPKFLLATLMVVGAPLLAYSVLYGFFILLKLYRPPYLLISGFVGAIITSSALIWIGRKPAI